MRLDKFEKHKNLPGRSWLIQVAWYFCNVIFFKNGFWPINSMKTSILRLFGARIGNGVVIKPSVNIKFPWKLTVGNHVWIGENVWIDNLAEVVIRDHVCLSQGALLLTGNHDFSKSTFDLIHRPILIESGAWIGAQAVVTSGVTIGKEAVLSVKSVASQNLEGGYIYRGNPAQVIKERKIERQ